MTDTKTGTQELREALYRGLALRGFRPSRELTDLVLALPELAALIADADRWREAMHGDPTEPLPLAMQARDLLVRCRELEAEADESGKRLEALLRVRRERDALRAEVRSLYAALTRALDGEPQP